jgi:hypothetical protein
MAQALTGRHARYIPSKLAHTLHFLNFHNSRETMSAPVLTNGGKGSVTRPREEFVVHFPHYDRDAAGPASVILLGDFKLIRIYESGALRLFNITKDPGERNDLAKEMPDKTKELNQRLGDYLTAVNAQMPRPNPDYDPSRPTQLPEPMRGGGMRRAKP